MASVGVLSLSLLLLFSSVCPAALLGPPLPLDPALSAIAPEECLWYGSSAGTAVADPKSENQTEQLLAEPEVQQLEAAVKTQVLRLIGRNIGPDREMRVLARELPTLVEAVLSLPHAIFVEDVQATEAGVMIQAGWVLSAGEQRGDIQNALKRLLETESAQQLGISSIELNGETWSVLRPTMQAPEIRWGWHNNYFILAVGDGTAEKIIERMAGSPPAWLEELRNEHPVQRESSLGYFNVSLILQRLRPLLESQDAWPIVEKLGITSIDSAHSIAGFDGDGCMNVSHLATDGQRQGLLGLLPYKPLSKRDLRTIPRDAMIAVAVRADVDEIWDEALRLVSEFQPRVIEEVDRGLWEFETQFGVNVKDDLVKSLDDVWVAYLPAGDLMTSWLGSAVAVRVKDAARLNEALDQLIAAAEARMHGGRRRGVSIRQSESEGFRIHYLNFVGESIPVAPAWGVSDEWLVLGLMPQTVRSVLMRESDESLADAPAIRELLAASDSPSMLSYCDTPSFARSLYPLIQIGAQLLSSELQKQGFDVDVSLLPSPDSVIEHLRPSVGAVAHASDGYYFTSRQSLPGGGMIGFAPLAFGLGMPAAQGARQAARRNSELNNMKFIALAFHNYANSRNQFVTNIYDDQEEPLLSWRVSLLPYLEQETLYREFHLDEPWDSEHNLKLLERMPAVFASPLADRAVAPGHTQYLALAGAETPFPGNRKLTFASVRDGLSNTLMFVRADSDHAVPWTKPTDIEVDSARPFQGLGENRSAFAAAFCDGSCRMLSLAIGEDTMRALTTRNGGEVIERETLNR